MKSPAILFYTSDFLTGVSDLTMEERGQYITLLCLQHQTGHLSLKTIKLNVPNASEDVLQKFLKDEAGNYYNERMEKETEKRNIYIESRYQNGYKGGRPKGKPNKNHMVKHMGNHIGNDNDNVNDNNKDIEKEIVKGKNQIENYNEIIDYLNLKTNSSYKSTTPKTRELIKARYNEGFTLDDFKQVIDNKVNSWGNDEKMVAYLRPETLFSNKFESYLNEKVALKKLDAIDRAYLKMKESGEIE